MDFEMQPYIVYIKTDTANRITAVNSSAFLADLTGWVEIDSGHGDRYHHAQGNYFDKPLYDERGVHRYMHVPLADAPDRETLHTHDYNGEEWGIYERTTAEMDADYTDPDPTPSIKSRVETVEAALSALMEGLSNE